MISLDHVQNRERASVLKLTRLDELERDAIVLLERLVETRLREVLEGMVGGFFGAGGTIILHSLGLLLLVTSSFFLTGVTAVAAVTHDLPPAARRLTSLSLFLLALADVVRNDDSLLLMRLLLLLITLIYLLVIYAHRCVVDSQWHGLPNRIFIDTQELVRRVEDVHAQKSSLA